MSISSYTRNFEDNNNNNNNNNNNSRETMIEEFYFDPKTNSTSATAPVRKLSSSSSSLYYDINQQPSTILLPTNIRTTTSPNSQTNNSSSYIKNVPISYTSSEYVTTTTGPNNHINTTSKITSSRSPHLSTPQLKCNRCDKLTRKFESLITCTNPSCGKLFHKRCVIFPYASNERDNVWKCEDCESIYGISYKPQAALIRSGTSLKNLQSRPALAHSHTTSSLSGLPSFKYEDGRTHICNKVHTPRSTTRNFYYSRDTTNNSNTPTLSPRLNHKNSASVGSLDQKTAPVKYQDQDRPSKYDYFNDKKTKPNEGELELKLAQLNDIKNEMNAECEDIDAVQQNQASSSLQYLPSVDDQNKIFVKLNIRTLDEDEEEEEIEKLTNKNYEFILNDNKDNLSTNGRRLSNKHMQSPPPLPQSQLPVRTESRKSSQSDANNKLKTEKQKLINEIEINEDMIKNFDKQFESLISKNIVSDLENSSQKLNKFPTYEENRAYINGQLKASNSNSGEVNNWILKPTSPTEPPFLFRYNKPEPPQSHTFFHYATNEEEDKDCDGEEEEQIVEIEEDEQLEEELINDMAYNNQLINYDNENKKLINFTTFNKKEDQNSKHLKNTKNEEDKNKLENFYNIEDEDHDTTKEEDTTVIHISDNNYKSNYRIGQTTSISPVPVPPPPPAPSNMTSFQQVFNIPNNYHNKQPAPASQISHQVDVFRMKEMEKKIVYQDEKLRAQEEKIEELSNVIRKMSKDFELQKTTSSLKPKETENNNNNQVKKPDAFVIARNEGIKEDDAWRISLIDDLSLIFAKYLVRTCIF
jgi:hypothetical protein